MSYRLMFLMSLLLVSVIVHAQDDRVNVVASHSILADVVRHVTGDVADVTVTMPPGSDPHSFEASPGDLTTIADADLVFVNGANYEEGLLNAIENAAEDVQMVSVSSCVEMIPFGAGEHDHADEEMQEENHESDMATDESIARLCDAHQAEFDTYHADAADDHEYETLGQLYTIDCLANNCDPHVWMNPHNVMYWTMRIRDTLIEIDPANEDVYLANAGAYLSELQVLMHEFIEPLMDTLPEDDRILITSHDSLGYLAATFDFEIIGTIIPGGTTLAEPSVQDIAGLIDLIRAESVPAIFGESTVNDSVAQTIADETGAELIVLYSGSLSDESGPAATYLDYIRYNYRAIVEALGGGA